MDHAIPHDFKHDFNAASGYTVSASPGVLNRLGWIADRMANVARANLIVVDPAEIIAIAEDSAPDQPEIDTLRTRVNLLDYFNACARPQDTGYLTNFLINNPDTFADIADRIMNDEAAAVGLDLNEDGKTDTGIVITGDMEKTPRALVSGMTGIPEDLIAGDLPGDPEDVLYATMIHEARHVSQPEFPLAVEREADADRASLNDARSAIAAGLPVDPAFLRLWKDVRFAGSLNSEGGFLQIAGSMLKGKPDAGTDTHDTHFLLDSESGLPAMTAAGRKEYAGMLWAKTFVNGAMGTKVVLDALKQMKDGRVPEAMQPFFETPLDMLFALQNPARIAEIGAQFSLNDPLGSKGILDALRGRNFFNPATEAYAARMDDFYDRYVPGYKDDPAYRDTFDTIAALDLPTSAEPPAAKPGIRAPMPVPKPF